MVKDQIVVLESNIISNRDDPISLSLKRVSLYSQQTEMTEKADNEKLLDEQDKIIVKADATESI